MFYLIFLYAAHKCPHKILQGSRSMNIVNINVNIYFGNIISNIGCEWVNFMLLIHVFLAI